MIGPVKFCGCPATLEGFTKPGGGPPAIGGDAPPGGPPVNAPAIGGPDVIGAIGAIGAIGGAAPPGGPPGIIIGCDEA
jgi:hypothetical protein